jgi:hypothetical protein
MDYRDFAMQYFLCILRVELLKEKNVPDPENGPVWAVELIRYLLSEYANSREGLFIIGKELALNNDFASLKSRLLNIDHPDFEEANDKCKWKEK